MSPIITLLKNAEHRPGVQFVVAEKSGCWYWTLHFARDGCGLAHMLGRTWQAHRFVYETRLFALPGSFLHALDLDRVPHLQVGIWKTFAYEKDEVIDVNYLLEAHA